MRIAAEPDSLGEDVRPSRQSGQSRGAAGAVGGTPVDPADGASQMEGKTLLRRTEQATARFAAAVAFLQGPAPRPQHPEVCLHNTCVDSDEVC